ncbi:MAG: hypothetical protein AD742_21685 [Methylibium sp. NZG]|nr:MAG: hypothetical protein AD742_21685 [Methylibium sp. NZG]
MKHPFRRGLALSLALSLTLWLVAGALSAHAADAPRKYAVLSLIGDSLTLVTHRPSVGTRVDPNIRDTVALSDPVFDDTVLLAAEQALLRAAPAAGAPALLSTSGPTAYAESQRWINEQKFTAPAWLDAALKADRATHLLLVTKHRAEVRIQFVGKMMGVGSLEGLGYFIDRQTVTLRSDTGAQGIGYLAPYAYFRMALIDLGTSTLLGQQLVTATRGISGADSKDGLGPWDVMTDADKVSYLKQLLGREVEKVVPALIKAPS